MKLGITIGNFSWPVPVSGIGPVVSRIARTADDAGVDSLWVMDHFFQIRLTGQPPTSPMPEAYATLAFLAGQTRHIRLGTLVTSVAYRHPGVLIKTVTALDVFSGGRAIFGVGAGAPWNIEPTGPGTAFEAEGPSIDHVLVSSRQRDDHARVDRSGRRQPALRTGHPRLTGRPAAGVTCRTTLGRPGVRHRPPCPRIDLWRRT